MASLKSKSIELTKRFKALSCRSCGGKVLAKAICLDCNEPVKTWCESCFLLEKYIHFGHLELEL